MEYITASMLKTMRACPEERRVFKALFPSGRAEVSPRSLHTALHYNLSLNFLMIARGRKTKDLRETERAKELWDRDILCSGEQLYSLKPGWRERLNRGALSKDPMDCTKRSEYFDEFIKLLRRVPASALASFR